MLMNKHRIILFLLLLAAAPVAAQEVQSDSTAGRTLGDNPRPRRNAERNVLGAPVYYDTLGNVIGSSTPADTLYRRPRHHYLNRLEDEYNNFFLEMKSLVGTDLAVGCQLAYVPNRWGIYCAGLTGFRYGYFTAGPVLRMSDCGDFFDWQLFGGLTVSHRPGAELGFRMAGPRSEGGFAWTSFSMSLGFANNDPYFTVGLSLSLAPEVLFFWF